MKRLYTILAALMLAIAAGAQTLNVKVGNVTYKFPAAQAGEMTYSGGTTLTILNKEFDLSEISSMTVDNSTVTDDAIDVVYEGTTAEVTVAGNIAQWVTVEVTGAHVSVAQADDLATEITYNLSGSSEDGGFYTSGAYKATLQLNGLTLTNQSATYSGAAIDVQNSKRINIKLAEGTTNTLVDATGGSQKGCLYVKGHAEFKQKGTLYVTGNVKHGIKTGEYMSVKNANIYVTSAVGDAVNCEQYFMMESGTLNLSGMADDGIQCDIETASTGETTDHEDEDSGNVYISGGTIVADVTGIACKGIKAEGNVNISGGTIDITTSGNGKWSEDISLSTGGETKGASCINGDADVNITGGNITLKSTGSGGSGMKCDGMMTINGGTIDISTTGGLYYNNGTTENLNYTGNTDNVDSNYYTGSKGIKAGTKESSGSNSYTYSGGLVINGGNITVSTATNNAEGIESKNTMYITDGTITVNSYDDGINSARDMHIQGGTLTVVAKNNDAIDSNGDLYIEGGTVIACGASAPECGLDAAEQYHLYITGGIVLAIGGSNNAVTSKSGSQYVLSTSSLSASAGGTIAVKSGTSTIASFTVPSTYSASSGGGNMPFSFEMDVTAPGGGGGGMPGGQGSNILISTPDITSGTYTVTSGSSSASVTASTSTSGGMH
ncbi:MAG: carbohydrate-binding domain-containing protein [Prevotella sp.]|nr:carbohydrate-binding domain-containing protein [Prevotella sp.]